MKSTKIKICGLFRINDTDFINEAMPDYAGFVFYERSHRYVTKEQARCLRQTIHSKILTVGVFVNHDLQFVKELYDSKIISIIQLHGDENEEYISALKAKLPSAEIWKAFTVRSSGDILKAEKSTADRILLDNGGGTGKSFDWSLAKGLNKDIILAGGLNPENIRQAVESFNPYAVDLSSGVEKDNVKDRDKIIAAVRAVREISI